MVLFGVALYSDSSKAAWAGIWLFASATIVWLALFGILTATILQDAAKLAARRFKNRRASRRQSDK